MWHGSDDGLVVKRESLFPERIESVAQQQNAA
jgi:hypothetical protein